MAANDLGEAQVALERSEEAREERGDDSDVAYEHAVALFELCRFKEAREEFTRLLSDDEHGAHAHHQLGLILEREGKVSEAEAHFQKATQLSPEDFPPPQLLPGEGLPPRGGPRPGRAARRHAQGPHRACRSRWRTSPAPTISSTETRRSRPPSSASSAGPPLGEPCGPEDGPICRSVVLYRKNLARAVTSRDELLEQIRVTLLHEVGHLRGEDDLELAARGLE